MQNALFVGIDVSLKFNAEGKKLDGFLKRKPRLTNVFSCWLLENSFALSTRYCVTTNFIPCLLSDCGYSSYLLRLRIRLVSAALFPSFFLI